MLDAEYRPIESPEEGVHRPKHISRVKAFIYACANYAPEHTAKVANGKGA